ncbi:MAG: LysR family transcriptional regulator [Firmicutes bacterium]|nr:LysR family transcriptional regulator [Bacillota bacterium]
MNLSQYEAFVKAAEAGTMTKAAEELGYTQSGLTRALNSLEEKCGFKLLMRGRNGVQLTTEDELILPYIRTVLHDQRRLSERMGEINGLREGLIRIGTFNSVSAQWLPGMIKEFRQDFPGIRFRLLHGTDEQIVSWIADGQVDVGFVAYPTSPGLESDFLYRDPIVAIFSEDDRHAHMDKFRITALPDLPYIALNEGVEDEITAILNQNKITPDATFVESDDHAVIAMVEQGLGISLMSAMMLQGFNRRIKPVSLDPPGYRDLGIACRSRSLLSGASSMFYEYACRWVKENYLSCDI